MNEGNCTAAAMSVHCTVYFLFYCRYANSYLRGGLLMRRAITVFCTNNGWLYSGESYNSF